MRRLFTVLHIAAAAAACAGGDARSGGAAEPFRVALMTPGSISDQAWNGGAYAGLTAIRDSLGAQISHIETRTPAEFDENFRAFGSQGYDLVFGHGFEFQDAAERVAPDFPRTTFVSTGGNRAVANAIGMEFAFEEGSFVAGMVAASITRTNIVGCIGGEALPPVERSFAAFAEGARAVNPAIRVVTSYLGSWDDVSAGKEQALAQIGRGVDVIFGNADAAGLGVFQAAREASNVRVIGANSDQAHVAPEVVIGSVVIDLPRAFLTLAREVRDGLVESRVRAFGSQSDVVRWVDNPQLAASVPAAARAAIDSVIAGLRAGAITLQAAPAPAGR